MSLYHAEQGVTTLLYHNMRKEQEVSLTVLGKICNVLDCDFGDIVEYKKERKSEKDGERVSD